MKRRHILLIVVISGLCNNIYAAGNRDITQIRRKYNQVKNGQLSLQTHHLTLKVFYAGIGLQTTRINFLHTSKQTAPEKDPYLMSFELVKVVVRYNIAASQDFIQEFLFNKKGQLIFYYRKIVYNMEAGKSSQERYYFKQGNLIKMTVSGLDHQKDKGKQRLPVILAAGSRYQHLFKSLVIAEQMKY